MTNKERMLQMVLDDPILQDRYDYEKEDYEDLHSAMSSENVVVAAVARIIKELDGSKDEAVKKKVYKSVFNYISENYLL